MYDRKVVRRRRAALAVFVVLSIAILTAYFGESSGGFFHTLQRGAQEAFAPIETGASRALKPLRDFVGWAGDTIDAKDQNADLKKEVRAAARPTGRGRDALRDAGQLKGLASLRQENYFPQATDPVTARVIARSSTVWYSTLKIDKGSERRPAREPAGDRGGRADRQAHQRHRRHGRGAPDHRRAERRVRAGLPRRA